MVRILMLGGTEFVGRAVTEEALSVGWQVTVFHRGRHEPPPGVVAVRGDRQDTESMAPLGRKEWDIVVDTWSGAPKVVRDTARLLAERAGHYVYLSSRSIYDFPVTAPLTEERPVVEASPDAGDVDYRQAKAGGELAASTVFAGRALLVRPGLVFGPGENTGRVPWWLRRVSRGGPVLAPGPRDAAVQYIDARDLARWILHAAARRATGVYNLVCPPEHATMEEFLTACVAATGSDAELRWTEPERILAAGIRPWTDLPTWLPPGPMYDLLHQTDVSKAVSAGLECRSLTKTVADTWDWMGHLDGPLSKGSLPHPDDVVGLTPELEAKVLRG